MKDEVIINNMRNSNFEIMRIISMILILMFHVSRNFENDHIITFLGSWSIVGVDYFIILSGFYSSKLIINNQKIIKTYKSIIYGIAFYYLLFVIIRVLYELNMVCVGGGKVFFEIISYITNDLKDPMWVNTYWFLSAYIIMFLIVPILNRIPEENTMYFLKLFSFIPFIAMFQQKSFSTICDVTIFCYLYIVGKFIRENYRNISMNTVKILLMTIIIIFSVFKIFNISEILQSNSILIILFGNSGRYSFDMIIISALIVCFIAKMSVTFNYKINYLASLMMGIYMFHESPVFNLSFNLYKILNNNITNQYICFIILTTFLFINGCFVEAIRKYFVKRVSDNHKQSSDF